MHRGHPCIGKAGSGLRGFQSRYFSNAPGATGNAFSMGMYILRKVNCVCFPHLLVPQELPYTSAVWNFIGCVTSSKQGSCSVSAPRSHARGTALVPPARGGLFCAHLPPYAPLLDEMQAGSGNVLRQVSGAWPWRRLPAPHCDVQ